MKFQATSEYRTLGDIANIVRSSIVHYAIAFKKYFKRMNILKEVFRDQLGKTIRMKVHATSEYKTFGHIVECAWNISSNCSHIDNSVK